MTLKRAKPPTNRELAASANEIKSKLFYINSSRDNEKRSFRVPDSDEVDLFSVDLFLVEFRDIVFKAFSGEYLHMGKTPTIPQIYLMMSVFEEYVKQIPRVDLEGSSTNNVNLVISKLAGTAEKLADIALLMSRRKNT